MKTHIKTSRGQQSPPPPVGPSPRRRDSPHRWQIDARHRNYILKPAQRWKLIRPAENCHFGDSLALRKPRQGPFQDALLAKFPRRAGGHRILMQEREDNRRLLHRSSFNFSIVAVTSL